MKEVCLEDLIKPNQASHQGARWTSSVSMLKVPGLALIIETSTVWPWYRTSFQGICRGLWIIIAELTVGLFPWSFAWCSPHAYCRPEDKNSLDPVQTISFCDFNIDLFLRTAFNLVHLVKERCQWNHSCKMIWRSISWILGCYLQVRSNLGR
jgi:hypothetical protein